jgi:hypothetical protein
VRQVTSLKDNGKTVGAITYSEDLNSIDLTKFHLVLSSTAERYAREIFRALRDLDSFHVDSIVVERVEEKGIGSAIMDRLLKAAETR